MDVNLYNTIHKIFDTNIKMLFKQLGNHAFYRITQNYLDVNNPIVIPQTRKKFTSKFGNYHTQVIDNHLKERKLPLRSKCIMFETDSTYVIETYEGRLACVIPEDKAKLCWVDSQDLWGAFYNTSGVETFNHFTLAACNYLGFDQTATYDNVLSLYKHLLLVKEQDKNTFDLLIKNISKTLIKDEYSLIIQNPLGVYEIVLYNIHSPVDEWLKNEVFELDSNIHYSLAWSFIENFPDKEIEVWTDAACLVIDYHKYEDFMSDYMAMST